MKTKKYAFYTLIQNDPDKRAYLLPRVNKLQAGHRSEIIRAIQTDNQSPKGKYVFEISRSDYPLFKERRGGSHIDMAQLKDRECKQ